jgi:prophage DNA circulation protein
VPFKYINTSDGFKKRLVKHDLPYKNGSLIEDLGLSSPTVTLTAVFMGENYPYLKDFLVAVAEPGRNDLVHPIMGTFYAFVESADVTHDDRVGYAEVRVTFVLQDKIPTAFAPADSAEMKETAIAESAAETVADAESALASFMGGVKNGMAQLNAVKAKAGALVNKATEPFKLLTSAISFATTLEGDILGIYAGGIESAAGTFQTAINAPAAFTRSLKNGMAAIEAALQKFRPPPAPGQNSPPSTAVREGVARALEAAYKTVAASAIAKAAAVELSIDEALENGVNLNLQSRGSTTSADRPRLMTIDEIDSVTADARGVIGEAIASAAAFGPQAWPIIAGLEKQARLLQESADAVRLRRERLVKYEAQNPTSIWLLSFRLYGSVDQVDRLPRINAIAEPNFIPAGRELNIYA